MVRTRVKICGITRPEDAALAAELGADAIGLNFVGGPRKINVETARRIMELMFADLGAPKITPVGLTYSVLDDRGDAISAARISHDVGIHTFQLYDDIAVKTYSHQKSGLHYWYVVHVASRDLSSLRSLIIPDKLDGSEIEAIVLDTASDKLGGTGKSFNWNWIAETRAAGELEGLPPIILAGGLNPENVADAIRIARPYAVDVSSGVEVAGKLGVKDPIKMRDFIQAAHGA